MGAAGPAARREEGDYSPYLTDEQRSRWAGSTRFGDGRLLPRAARMSGMDLSQRLGKPSEVDASLSALARGVVGSEILRIAAEIRALKAKGAAICNLTVGDFDPASFPVPASLLEGVRAALAAGHTNYPPSDGVLALREAVARFYERGLGLKYPVESVLVTGGARPLLYGTYRTILDP